MIGAIIGDIAGSMYEKPPVSNQNQGFSFLWHILPFYGRFDLHRGSSGYTTPWSPTRGDDAEVVPLSSERRLRWYVCKVDLSRGARTL